MILPFRRLRWRASAYSRARICLSAIILIFAIAVALTIFFGVWRRDGSLANARKNGVIYIGYAVEPPYAFIDPEGQVTGLDPEMARRIVSRLGISRVEWRLAEFGSLIDGLNAHHFDVIAAGMLITPEREKQAAFSLPAFKVNSALLVQKGNPHHLHSYADVVRNDAVRIAVLSGSFEEKLLVRLGVPPGRLVHVPDALSGRILVETAQVDGLALTTPSIRWMIDQKSVARSEMATPFEAADDSSAPDGHLGAFAFRKADRALQAAWNRELTKFIGNTEHLRIAGKFGFTTANVPGAAANSNLTLHP